MGAEGPSLLGFSGILPEGLSGPAPTGGLLSCANKKVTKEIARGPLPAPWTPGAVVRDLQPLCAFNLEPSSGLSAAWVDTRRPPPFGCWNWEGAEFGGWVFYRGWGLAERTSPALRATSPFQGEAERGGRWPLSPHQPASPPWGEGRERGQP